uniref:Secreted Thiol reductase-like protein n=1 Tax=Pristhesancus plagipennis TaxID=1955184 RepID=A0A2K8JSD8_PRIPG|nr:secreted Thiol reductase-like protein [Pristhesancus plagipennis]
MSPIAYMLFILATATTILAQNHKMTPVTVYYESLCPDSIKFITMQLFPAWETELKSYMNLTLVPFGKANYTQTGDNYTLNCHHGVKECVGNKVQACALKKIMDMDMKVKFINCVMTETRDSKPEEYPTKKCANDLKLAADLITQIESCATSAEGDGFFVEMGEMTNKYQNPLTSVPTVSINNDHNTDNKAATSNFQKTLCSHITDPKPAICTKNGGSSITPAILLVPLSYLFTLKF